MGKTTKKMTAIEKARSLLKKAEHANTPSSIKRKLSKKTKEKTS